MYNIYCNQLRIIDFSLLHKHNHYITFEQKKIVLIILVTTTQPAILQNQQQR